MEDGATEPFSTSAFEKSLRNLIEAGSFAAAEDLVRAASADEPDLMEALEQTRDSASIEGWTSIAAEMEDAKRYLRPDDVGKEWKAVFAGLVNHTGHEALFIEITFGIDAEPRQYAPETKPSFMTDEQFAEYERDVADRIFLPSGHRYRASYDWPGLAVAGLEPLVEIERAHSPPPGNREAWDRHSKRATIAAGAILLRFHETVERCSTRYGLPRSVPLFVHVARVEWPMEVGIYEFGTDATRILHPSSERFDHAEGARIVADRREERAEAYIDDTRRMIVELRELQEAVQLWPWWLRPLTRATFASYVRDVEELTRKSIRAMHGVDTRNAAGQRLYELIAVARHPDAADVAFEPIDPADRRDLQKIAINFARRFGGRHVRERFRDYPPVPPELLGTVPTVKRRIRD